MENVYILVHNFKYAFMRVEEIITVASSIDGIMKHFDDREVFRNKDGSIILKHKEDSRKKNDFTEILYTEGTEEYSNNKERLMCSESDFLLIRIYMVNN